MSAKRDRSDLPHVVIVGGGFGGSVRCPLLKRVRPSGLRSSIAGTIISSSRCCTRSQPLRSTRAI